MTAYSGANLGSIQLGTMPLLILISGIVFCKEDKDAVVQQMQIKLVKCIPAEKHIQQEDAIVRFAADEVGHSHCTLLKFLY